MLIIERLNLNLKDKKYMKTTIHILFLSLVMSINSFSQELTWHTDMNKASELAIEQDKPVLMFFTGSDWCGWCIRLQNQVLKTDAFKTWASENVVLVELDFPRRKKIEKSLQVQNAYMQQLLKVRGYPTVVFVKPQKVAEGKMSLNNLGATGYVQGGPEKWLEVANNIINVN